MGLAAIVFDASDFETTAGFVRRGVLPSNSSSQGETLDIVISVLHILGQLSLSFPIASANHTLIE